MRGIVYELLEYHRNQVHHRGLEKYEGSGMYVTIDSKNEQTQRHGRGPWLNSEIKDLHVVRESPKHLGAPPWYIEFKGDTREERGTGERGGEVLVIERDMKVQLNPQDLAVLVNFALKHQLLTITVEE